MWNTDAACPHNVVELTLDVSTNLEDRAVLHFELRAVCPTCDAKLELRHSDLTKLEHIPNTMRMLRSTTRARRFES